MVVSLTPLGIERNNPQPVNMCFHEAEISQKQLFAMGVREELKNSLVPMVVLRISRILGMFAPSL